MGKAKYTFSLNLNKWIQWVIHWMTFCHFRHFQIISKNCENHLNVAHQLKSLKFLVVFIVHSWQRIDERKNELKKANQPTAITAERSVSWIGFGIKETQHTKDKREEWREEKKEFRKQQNKIVLILIVFNRINLDARI